MPPKECLYRSISYGGYPTRHAELYQTQPCNFGAGRDECLHINQFYLYNENIDTLSVLPIQTEAALNFESVPLILFLAYRSSESALGSTETRITARKEIINSAPQKKPSISPLPGVA